MPVCCWDVGRLFIKLPLPYFVIFHDVYVKAGYGMRIWVFWNLIFITFEIFIFLNTLALPFTDIFSFKNWFFGNNFFSNLTAFKNVFFMLKISENVWVMIITIFLNIHWNMAISNKENFCPSLLKVKIIYLVLFWPVVWVLP